MDHIYFSLFIEEIDNNYLPLLSLNIVWICKFKIVIEYSILIFRQQIKLTADLKSDTEVSTFQGFYKDKVIVTPLNALNFIKQHNVQELHPSLWIVLRN